MNLQQPGRIDEIFNQMTIYLYNNCIYKTYDCIVLQNNNISVYN